MKALVVFGTRPEAIKLAPVIQELRRRAKDTDLRTVVCVTAQHRQMLDQVLGVFGISPDYDLNLMEENQTPAQVASSALVSLEPILQQEQPDWVVTQGDTTTVAAVSLAAFYSRTKVAHVEAGLRTHVKWQPFPEEMNRRVASAIADLHLAPTQRAKRNLLREGVSEQSIVVTGNPVIDAMHQVLAQPTTAELVELLPHISRGHKDREPKLILVTAHRRDNFGSPLESICLGLKELASRYQGRVSIVYPVHLNPNVQEPIQRILAGVPGITLLPPVDYVSLVHLMERSYLVLTDSGGIQEEAPALGKPVLVMRDVTERPEAVEAGTVRLVGTGQARIVAETARLLEDSAEYERMARSVNPYGDGRASQRIGAALLGEAVEQFVPQAG